MFYNSKCNYIYMNSLACHIKLLYNHYDQMTY